MAYWLLKTEPASYSWDDLVRDGSAEWDGVRNHAAAAHLRMMSKGDEALIYHSGADKAAVGIATITRAARKDGDGGDWVSVAIAPVAPLPAIVTLKDMKAAPPLAGMAMLRQPRLSVSPVTAVEWCTIATLAGNVS
jgi:predicted RNA-binding protein with PUA-like domain